jgi:mannose-6-phosphate isomerase-like protein (cupin superfamily)
MMPDDKHRTYDVLGLMVRFLAFPDELEGKFTLAEALVPKGLGAPPNSHAGETEAFYVLEGEVDFMVDGAGRRCGPGAFLTVPDGAAHAFAGASEKPARMLILTAPGRMHERFFTAIGTPMPETATEPPKPSAPDLGKVFAIAHEVGMTILAPAEA